MNFLDFCCSCMEVFCCFPTVTAGVFDRCFNPCRDRRMIRPACRLSPPLGLDMDTVRLYNAAFTPRHMPPGNTYPGRETCIRIHICRRTHVAGYKLLVRDTYWLCLGDIIIIHLCHGRRVGYSFVSSNRRATNWRQFCRRYKKHVDGDKWLQVDTTCIRQHVS